jgi:hypothetical protein
MWFKKAPEQWSVSKLPLLEGQINLLCVYLFSFNDSVNKLLFFACKEVRILDLPSCCGQRFVTTTRLDWLVSLPAGKVYRISEGSLGERVSEAINRPEFF